MKKSLLTTVVAALALAGCMPQSQDSGGWVQPRPLGAGHASYRPPGGGARTEPPRFSEPTGELTLAEALAAALLGSPELRAYAWELRAADARVLQAGLLPNPELEVDVEEFGGEGERAGFDGAETALHVSQLIELGGKRGKRRKVAALERSLAGWDYEAKRLDVLTETARSFLAVLEAQERMALAGKVAELSRKVSTAVEARVAAGKVSPLEKAKAAVELASGRIELEKARRELETSRRRLAAQWGGTAPRFGAIKGAFGKVVAIPELSELLALGGENPDLARWKSEIMLRRAALELERANRAPDLELSAGVSRYEETEDHAFSAGVGVPLPLFDRNQGGIREARSNLRKALEEKRAGEIAAVTETTAVHNELVSLAAELKVLDGKLLPAALKAFEAAQAGYAQGKFNYLEVIDAQRTLVEARTQRLDTIADYHRALIDMERLIGRPLSAVGAPQEKSKKLPPSSGRKETER
jgi:cobalt-zinc-cadmium efflux system outer membrane protein